MVKRLRLRPLTAATRVRIPIESPQKNLHPQDCRFLFLRSFSRLRTSSRPCVLMAQDVMLPGRVIFVLHICQPALVPIILSISAMYWSYLSPFLRRLKAVCKDANVSLLIGKIFSTAAPTSKQIHGNKM